SSQNTCGRTTARAYFGMSAQLSPFTSLLACPFALPRNVSPQLLPSGVEYHRPASVAPLVDALSRTWCSAVAAGRFETKLTTPLIAPAPYRDDATPLITSTRPRSIGGICIRPRET